MMSVKDDVIKTKRNYLEEFKYFGRIQCLKFFVIYHWYLFYDGLDVFTTNKMCICRNQVERSS